MLKYENSFVVNNDIEGLKPIRISLPKAPRFELIDGYRLKKEDQYFRREVYPEKLKQLEKEVKEELRGKETLNHYVATPQKIIDSIWEKLEEKYEYYEKEIKWIEKQWWHRINGYWFFNNGEPTYIDGWHWFYLNYWYMGDVKGRYAEYRSADREQILFLRYLYTTHETFKNINEATGEAIPDENGEYEMEELPKRTFYGCIQGKNRRRGVTHVACCIGFELITKAQGDFSFGLQSYTSDQIRSAYKKIMEAWKHMPFFFKPIWKGREQPDGIIEFTAERKDDALGTRIDPAETGEGTYYDGQKLLMLLSDEEGKTTLDILHRWSINKRTLSVGDGSSIHGLTYHPSTVSEMEQDAADKFEALCVMSNFYKREKTGETSSGMAFLAFPSWKCLEGFIDRYGNAIIDMPNEQQIKDGFGFKYGSKRFLENKRESLLNSSSPEALKELRRTRKEFPFDLEDMFLKSDNSELDFNYDAISKRLIEIKRATPTLVETFDLKWDNNVKDSNVVKIPNPNGRFQFSFSPDQSEVNKKVKKKIISRITGRPEESWSPLISNKYIIGADPFKYSNLSDAELKKKKRLLSEGGIAMRFFNGRLMVTYKTRPLFLCNDLVKIDQQLRDNYYSYCEDLILLAVYFGSLVFPENNLKDVGKYFRERGYSDYLLHEKNADGTYKSDAGGYTNDFTKNEIFEYNKSYIEQFVAVECHLDFLNEASIIKGKSDMTNQDLFTAVGYCNKGNAVLNDQQAKPKKKHDISKVFSSSYFRTRKYA